MEKYVLDLDLFIPGFIFEYKGNKHLVIKTYSDKVLVINLSWDDCMSLENLIVGGDTDIFKWEEELYYLSYADLEEEFVINNMSEFLKKEEINLQDI